MASANYNLELDTNWKFHLGELPRKSEIPINLAHKTSKTGGALDELDFFGECVCWTPIDLPHDWLTDLTPNPKAYAAGGFKARETAWYTLPFHLPADSIESAKLIFEGVLGNCIVYVNGVEAARNFSGYNRFDIQIEDYLLPNVENRIALYVDARRWEGWWYEGAGLYRPVRIEFRPFTHFSKKDCFITTEKNETNWKIHHQLAISGNQDHTAVSFAIKDADVEIGDVVPFLSR